MEIIKRDLYIEGTYYGDVHQGDIFVVFNKDIINDTFVAKTKDDTKYFITLGYSQKKFTGIVINSKKYDNRYSIEISDRSNYSDILKHESYFGCSELIEVYEDDLYFYTRYNNNHLSLTNEDLKNVIDKLYYIANNLISFSVTKDNLIKYSIFNKTKVIFESMITKFNDFVKYIYNKSALLRE